MGISFSKYGFLKRVNKFNSFHNPDEVLAEVKEYFQKYKYWILAETLFHDAVLTIIWAYALYHIVLDYLKNSEISWLLVIWVVFLAALAHMLYMNIFMDKVNGEVRYAKAIKDEGWNTRLENPRKLYDELASQYPFLNYGEHSHEIHFCVDGEYAGHLFTFFEFEYGITEVIDDSYTDSHGNYVYSTSTEESYFQNTYLYLKIPNSIFHIEFDGDKRGKKVKLPFFDIKRRKKMRSEDLEQAYELIDAVSKKVLNKILKKYKEASIEINQEGIFINFRKNLIKKESRVIYGYGLYKQLNDNYLVERIKEITADFFPVVKVLEHDFFNPLAMQTLIDVIAEEEEYYQEY